MEDGEGHAAGGFAEAIRAWRQRRGWTQEELSHASGLSTRAIRSLERGRTLKPRRTTVQMLADALQVPRARLMGTVRRAVGDAEADAEAEAGDDRPGWAGGRQRGGGPGVWAGGRMQTGGPRSWASSGTSQHADFWAGDAAAGGRPRGGGPGAWASGAATGSGSERAASGSWLPTVESVVGGALWPGSALPIPRELPPDLADREVDVREVVAELVAGPTGPYRAAVVRVAAAEVAVRAAHHASAKFPDGQLYASLAGTPPAAPSTVLRRFLRSLGLERPAEAGADELAAAFRSALAGRRMLVVLVDAQSEAQIRPLIPAEAQCALLVAFGSRPQAGPGQA